MGITIVPKVKKPKPKTLVWQANSLHEIKIHADNSFWEAWKKRRFDLSLIRVFYMKVPDLSYGEEIKITDGKSVIHGKRIDGSTSVLIDGYMLDSIYNEEWALENNYCYTSHYQTKIGLDHKGHFLKRYKERGFDLRLVASFIGKVAQAKLGQKVKMISEDEIIVGRRADAHNATLITGMIRGEIDMDDYVDWKLT